MDCNVLKFIPPPNYWTRGPWYPIDLFLRAEDWIRFCGCGNKTQQRRAKCQACYKRAWKIKYPLRATFDSLRTRARRDKIPFDLTLVDWEIWCGLYGYLELRGQGMNDMTVDRINTDPRKGYWGYRYDNMQPLTRIENGRKGAKERKVWRNGSPRLDSDVF